MKRGWLGIAVLLAGCAAPPSWIKPGADVGETALAYQSCRALATGAVQTDADIDQDILATRSGDLQRAGSYRVAMQDMQDQTKDRASRIVASCMQAKGFVEVR